MEIRLTILVTADVSLPLNGSNSRVVDSRHVDVKIRVWFVVLAEVCCVGRET